SSKLRLELLDLVSGKVKVENKTWKIQCVIDIYELAQRLLKRCIKYKTGTRFKLYTPLDFSFEFTVSPIVPRTKMGIPKERKIQVDILRQMLLFELPAKVEKRKRRQRKPNTKTNLSEKGKFKQLSLFDHNS
ncbi:hypothetical protein J7J45_05570, partial [Candidatus Aerophobetes bacterium]|nr:hypothetical protein [Candidatus Aerophobetes bacterium]